MGWQLRIQKDGCKVRFYQVLWRDLRCDECRKRMITVLGADGSDIYTRVKEVADRKLVHQMLNDALKDVRNNSSKSPILLVSNDKDFMGVIRDLRRYGYTVISAVSEMFAKNLPGVARLTQAFWFFEQLEKGHPPIHPSPMQNALAASVLISNLCLNSLIMLVINVFLLNDYIGYRWFGVGRKYAAIAFAYWSKVIKK